MCELLHRKFNFRHLPQAPRGIWFRCPHTSYPQDRRGGDGHTRVSCAQGGALTTTPRAVGSAPQGARVKSNVLNVTKVTPLHLLCCFQRHVKRRYELINTTLIRNRTLTTTDCDVRQNECLVPEVSLCNKLQAPQQKSSHDETVKGTCHKLQVSFDRE